MQAVPNRDAFEDSLDAAFRTKHLAGFKFEVLAGEAKGSGPIS